MHSTYNRKSLPKTVLSVRTKIVPYELKISSKIKIDYVVFSGRSRSPHDGVDVYVSDVYVGNISPMDDVWFADGGGDLEMGDPRGGGSRYFDNLQDAAVALAIVEARPPKNADRQAKAPAVAVRGLGSKRNRHQKRIMNPGKKTTKRKTSLKTKAKKAGRKVKKVAKTDVGRAGIGAGAGALLLGPIGAIVGAGYAIATKKKKKAKAKPKKNPGQMVKMSSTMGTVLLDYAALSDNVEHVAASALRGEKVELSVLKKARNDLKRSAKDQPQASEREQMWDLVDSLDRFLAKQGSPGRRLNPSLGSDIKRWRQSRVKKAIARSESEGKASDDAARSSLRSRLAKINPGTYVAELPKLSSAELDKERRAIQRLLVRAHGHPKTSSRMVRDIQYLRDEIDAEKKRRRRPNPAADNTLSTLISDYKRKRKSYERSRSARAKKHLADAESKVVLYADIQGIGPDELRDAITDSRRRANPKAAPKRNPLKKIPKGATRERARRIIKKNIITEIAAGRPQKQAVAIALDKARDDAPKLVNEMYGHRMNPERK